jgi:hypothetical protein
MYTTMAARCSGPTRQRLQNINCHRHDTTRHRASTFEPHTRRHTHEKWMDLEENIRHQIRLKRNQSNRVKQDQGLNPFTHTLADGVERIAPQRLAHIMYGFVRNAGFEHATLQLLK